MKLNTLHLTLLSSLFCSASAFADVTVNGGTVHFTGELVNAACAVSTTSTNLTVDLGQYRTGSLATVGNKTTPVPFSIQLVDCDPTVQGTASVAFYGQTDGTNPNLLSVSAGGTNANAAGNVGIEVVDDQSRVLAFAGGDFSNAKSLMQGTNELKFTARYVATGAATPGVANADATFVVHYE